MKYIWTYIDFRGKWYIKAKSYYSFGSSLHKVLERFHDSNDVGVQTVGDALKLYEESWIDAGYSSPEEMQEAYGEGRNILEDYLSNYLQAQEERLKSGPGVVTLSVEKLLKYDMGPFVLIGRIDRLDKHPDGTLEIIDYKSQREQISEDDVKTDFAMSCYQLLVRRSHPDSPVVATIDALKARKKKSASLTDEELFDFESDVLKLGELILSTSIEDHSPKVKELCSSCDFREPLCKKDPRYN